MKNQELFFGLTATGTVNAVLGNVHRQAQRDPHVARSVTRSERIGGRKTELVQDDVANEGAAEVLTEFGLNREGEFGMLHPFSVSGLPVEVGRTFGVLAELTLSFCRPSDSGNKNGDSHDG